MTTQPQVPSTNESLYQAWREGSISLTVDQLDEVLFGIDASSRAEFGLSGPLYEFDCEAFNNFVCT